MVYYKIKEGNLYTLLGIIITLIILVFLAALYSAFKSKIKFVISGLDAGFSLGDVNLLWKVSQLCELEQPDSLFYSLPSLTKCMSQITAQNQADGTEQEPKNLRLMSKLFDYRTKIQNESDDKKGMTSTKSLDKGQTLRIILPGKGVFVSEIVNNGSQLVINVPKQKNLIPISAEDWVGKVISVYLWRKGDARYVFDTTVLQHGLFLGKSAIYLKHSANLVRTQKRKSVRVKCEIYGTLFILKKNSEDLTTIETKNGYRCLIEDVSESGALIRIGGKGAENVKIKLQYSIKNKLILMARVIRTVEYNEAENQSLLHFECTHIDPVMKNEVLSFVYNMLPESEKEVLEALSQTDDDVQDDELQSGNESEKTEDNNSKVPEDAENSSEESVSAAAIPDGSESISESISTDDEITF